jgi:hypothetical protein
VADADDGGSPSDSGIDSDGAACEGETGGAPPAAPAESAGDAADPGEGSASAADVPDASARGSHRNVLPAKRRRRASGAGGGARALKGKAKAGRPANNEPCPRCASTETKFCYFNNYNVKQPRYYCKAGGGGVGWV